MTQTQRPLHETHTCEDCGAIITVPYAKPHEAGERHDYDLRCKVCGQAGVIRVSVDPDRDIEVSVTVNDQNTVLFGNEIELMAPWMDKGEVRRWATRLAAISAWPQPPTFDTDLMQSAFSEHEITHHGVDPDALIPIPQDCLDDVKARYASLALVAQP